MDRLIAVAVALVLLGCQPESASPSSGAAKHEPIGCPLLPASSGYTVTAEQGPDFVLCAVQPAQANGLHASLYIGNFPPSATGLRFAAFTAGSGRDLTWFSAGISPAGTRTWLTYVPTGNPRSSVMAISVQAKDRQDFLARGPGLAQQLIGASIAP